MHALTVLHVNVKGPRHLRNYTFYSMFMQFCAAGAGIIQYAMVQ